MRYKLLLILALLVLVPRAPLRHSALSRKLELLASLATILIRLQ